MKTSRRHRPIQRDALAIARVPLLDRLVGVDHWSSGVSSSSALSLFTPALDLAEVDAGVVLSEVEDSRRWTPEASPGLEYTPSRRLDGSPARFKAGAATKVAVFSPTPVVAFSTPSRVVVCVRRKRRREVLFARGVGGGRVRPGRRSGTSGISCKG